MNTQKAQMYIARHAVRFVNAEDQRQACLAIIEAVSDERAAITDYIREHSDCSPAFLADQIEAGAQTEAERRLEGL